MLGTNNMLSFVTQWLVLNKTGHFTSISFQYKDLFSKYYINFMNAAVHRPNAFTDGPNQY